MELANAGQRILQLAYSQYFTVTQRIHHLMVGKKINNSQGNELAYGPR